MSSVGKPINTNQLYPIQLQYLTTLKNAKRRRKASSVPHQTDPATAKPFGPGAGTATEYYSTDAGTQYDDRVPRKRSQTDRFIHKKPLRGEASWWFAVHADAFNGFVYHAINNVQVPEVEPQSAVASPPAVHPTPAPPPAAAAPPAAPSTAK